MGKKKNHVDGLNDNRFSRIKSDPIFAGLKNTEKKVVIDKRFAAALTDEKFSTRSKVDMRGRKQKKTLGNDLLDVYELEDDEKEEKKSNDVDQFFDEDEVQEEEEEDDDNDDEEEKEEEEEIEKQNKSRRIDLARGEGNVESSSDDDSDEEDDDDNEGGEKGGSSGGIGISEAAMKLELDLGQLDKDAPEVEWVSKRLAVCNLEWDQVSCEDVLMLVKSFLPAGGFVKTVGIYLSEFGEEQLALEEKQGPLVKLTKPLEEYKEDEMDEESKSAVRKYLMDRLKYYYAVVEFNSEESATAVYEQCDGFQFEETGLKMDLRFIPDEMEFEKERAREQLNASDVNMSKYKAKRKAKNSMASTNSKIAWDEDDPSRSRKLIQAFEGNEAAAKDLIADSDSENEDAEAEKNRNSLLELLKTDEKKEKLDVEWDDKQNSDESDGEYEKIEDSDEDEEDEEKKEKEEKMSGYQKYLTIKKEKKANLKLKKRKGENEATIKSAQVVEEVVNDERFNALFTDASFAIEPSSKKFKHSLLATKQAEHKAEAKKVRKVVEEKEDLIKKLKSKTEKWKNRK